MAEKAENDTRQEIIRIFRRYERLGLAREGLDPVRAYKRIEVVCASRRSKLEMLALYDTLRVLYLTGEDDVLCAIREVYFGDPGHRITASVISDRVLRCSISHYCDERTVYRRLKKARELYLRIRKNLESYQGEKWTML